MATAQVKNQSGGAAGSVELDEFTFGIEPNVAVMHQVVVAQLAARRAGTHSTKTRAEVAGGGAKPWRQKGTGRARQGSTRSPQWRGGGVAHGPKPRDYEQRTPKKMKQLALRSALSDRAGDGKVIVIDAWNFATPKTKDAIAALAAIGAEGNVLIVLDREDEAAWKSFRNLTNVHCVSPGELNTYDVLAADVVVFTTANLPVLTQRRKGGAVPEAEAAPVVAAAAAAPVVEEAPAVVEEPAVEEPVVEDLAAETEEPAGEIEAPYGPGSAAPLEDGSAPEGYDIKGNADSMYYHTPESRYYKQTKAEVWFATVEAAEAAGFTTPGSKSDDADTEGEAS
jgi:large subunit ribosomal protein L4